jgi:hypothetical protein
MVLIPAAAVDAFAAKWALVTGPIRPARGTRSPKRKARAR